MHQAVETYFREMSAVRGTGGGTSETSYYPPLITLLNTIGGALRPPVTAISQLRNTGSGLPDVGMFTAEQRAELEIQQPIVDIPPARGVVEVKALADDVSAIAASNQVRGYVEHYGQVLVTNYRDFLLVDHDANEDIRTSESITLAEDEAAFWTQARDPHEFAGRCGDQLVEYLHRVMVRQVSLTQLRDVALLLASYARDMRTRLERQNLDELAPIRDALESALGISFQGANGAHFFRSAVVQTLFYGMFSAWVLQKRDIGRGSPVTAFDWRLAGWHLKVPAIQTLFHEFSGPGHATRLGLVEVLDWTGEMLNRIDAEQFFARFSEDHAVQYFYEPFLEAFDPELRRQMGVWYTPHEIVTYMVERVDTVLREELGISRGLADENVYVLDPCTGTGSYLVAALRRIHKTLKDEGADALTANDLKQAAKNRLFGFELLPAPFVVAHLQLGLALQDLGAPLRAGSNERPAIFLTNALTGWDEISDERYTQLRAHSLLADLAGERGKAGNIKRETPILVVIGNPPYNGYAGMGVDEERDLSNAYRASRQTRQPQGQGLNDLYVRFFRMAERKIVEQTGRGVVCYISNYSWLDGLSFPAMRERYLDVFDQIWIDNLNGDRYRTGKMTPEGRPDPSMFSTDHNREGIQVGTAISLLVRREKHEPSPSLNYRSLWGATKLQQLESFASGDATTPYETVTPSPALGYPFKPMEQDEHYLSWPKLPDLFPTSFPGVKTSRDDVVVDVDRDRLVERMQTYFDPNRSDAEIARLFPGAMDSTSRFDASAVRAQLVKRGFLPDNVIRYAYRPFDVRWLYWEPETKLLDEKRTEYMPHVADGNVWFEARQRVSRNTFDRGMMSSSLGDNLGAGMSIWFPLLIRQGERDLPNTSDIFQTYLADTDAGPVDGFFHALATMHAPTYRLANDDALRQDWPRIPLPNDPEALARSSALGRQLAALLDIEQDVPGVSAGAIRPELRSIAVLAKRDGGGIDPDSGDLRIDANWGYGGNGRPVMPGCGRAVERTLTSDEASLLGAFTFDVWLNDSVLWANVPEPVWEYTLGGYQVLKKWLSYRESDVLGRYLHADEARTFSQIARRIAAILLLEDDLNVSYQRCTTDTWDWQTAAAVANPQKSLF
ncbi:DNA methyltransferase [soil metagenome]